MPRNSSGTYSLPAGNPVVTATVISSTWANTTLSDIATEMTDSLDRSGKGAMLAALQLFSGVIGAPGLNWSAETNSGLYRAAAGDFRYSIAAVDKLQLTTNGLYVANGAVATPAFGFISDPNTGIYSVGADDLGITTGGVLRLDISTTGITATIPFLGAAGSIGAPTFSFSGDSNTGVYNPSADAIGFSAGGVARAVVTTQGIGPNQDGAVATPAIFFNTDPDTGFYRISSGLIGVASDGINYVRFGSGVLASDGSVGSPVYTFYNDPDTGFYRGGTNDVRFTAGGTFIAGFQLSGANPFFYIADGSVTVPGFTFNNDPDTGIYRVSNNVVSFSSGGTLTFAVGGSQALAVDGTAAAPGYSFGLDADTGMYRVGANSIVITVGNGTQSIALDATTGFGTPNATSIGTLNSTAIAINAQSTASATAGGATLPANPQGFITISINGTSRKIPYYQT